MGKSIYASCCSRNTAMWNMFTSFQIAAGELGQKHGIKTFIDPYVGDSLISRARCLALYRFLKSDSDWLFTVDDDIELPKDVFTKLVEADKDLIGGLYRLKKNQPSQPYAIRFNDHNDIKYDDVVKVQYLSTGCMLYKREFVEKLVEQYPNLWFYENLTGNKIPALYMPYIYQNEYLSEDWAFCQRAIDKGHDVWLHAGVLCDHWGYYKYSIADLNDDQKEQ